MGADRDLGELTMRTFETIAELQPLVGQDIATSEWIIVTQERIQLFADATNDHQWIHVDPERAKAARSRRRSRTASSRSRSCPR
jgi:acyl dehydratase